MILGILVLLTALSISAVAIYYSVSGLVAIFAAAALPIIIMGSALEIGKLVTAVWLHKYWHRTKWWLRTYLTIATVILMFITSMGIFGFLSKAHIEQTSNAQEGVAQIERIGIDIIRQQAVIARAQDRILDIESKGSNNDDEIQQQINTEQQRIDSAYTRIQPAIDEQLAIVTKSEQNLTLRVQPLLDQAATIETTLSNLSTALADNNIRVAQGIVGAKQDGALGRNTSSKIQDYREAEEAKRSALIAQAEQIRTAPQVDVDTARVEISRQRGIAEQQIADSDKLISRLREQLGTEDVTAVEAATAEQQTKIINANNIIDTLTETKYTLQAEYRKLEAEVGPVKYLAEFIYGEDANENMLEEAVRWVILIIIFVFDPLAVLLLIASQATFEMRRQEYPRLTPAEGTTNDKFNRSNNDRSDWKGEYARSYSSIANRSSRAEETSVSPVDSNDRQTGTGSDGGVVAVGFFESPNARQIELDSKEDDETYKSLKQKWKSENPDQNIKFWKDQYIKSKIDKLPWETND
jgi:hypothetical protein